MSKQFAIVKKQNNQICHIYQADKQQIDLYWEFCDTDVWAHIEAPLNINKEYVRVECNKGIWMFYEDASKKKIYLQQKLQEYLSNVRNRRDKLLSQSDWTMSVSDAPLTEEQKNAWKLYRQQLRDIIKTITYPDQPVSWPVPPK